MKSTIWLRWNNGYIMGRQGTLKNINELVKEIQRDTFKGKGKPEPLRGNLSGLWSRRIDDVNRIVYYEEKGIIHIISCRGHYNK